MPAATAPTESLDVSIQLISLASRESTTWVEEVVEIEFPFN